jgi:hypothetical protein
MEALLSISPYVAMLALLIAIPSVVMPGSDKD